MTNTVWCSVFAYAALPQHLLNFLPEPQGHGSLRPVLGDGRPAEQGIAVLVAADREDREQQLTVSLRLKQPAPGVRAQHDRLQEPLEPRRGPRGRSIRQAQTLFCIFVKLARVHVRPLPNKTAISQLPSLRSLRVSTVTAKCGHIPPQHSGAGAPAFLGSRRPSTEGLALARPRGETTRPEPPHRPALPGMMPWRSVAGTTAPCHPSRCAEQSIRQPVGLARQSIRTDLHPPFSMAS